MYVRAIITHRLQYINVLPIKKFLAGMIVAVIKNKVVIQFQFVLEDVTHIMSFKCQK